MPHNPNDASVSLFSFITVIIYYYFLEENLIPSRINSSCPAVTPVKTGRSKLTESILDKSQYRPEHMDLISWILTSIWARTYGPHFIGSLHQYGPEHVDLISLGPYINMGQNRWTSFHWVFTSVWARTYGAHFIGSLHQYGPEHIDLISLGLYINMGQNIWTLFLGSLHQYGPEHMDLISLGPFINMGQNRWTLFHWLLTSIWARTYGPHFIGSFHQ